MKFLLILVLTICAAYIGKITIRALKWPDWSFHVLVLSIGIMLYLANNMLIWAYIRKNAPDFASKDECMPDIQKWELTVGTGIVPKWVSFIGIISIAFFLASPFDLLAWLLRTF
jgi:hypothetical protein